MSNIFEKLCLYNCDAVGVKERFLDDQELYLTCLEAVLDDSNFEKLGVALNKKDIESAYESAHTLKGVLANMGLTPLYDIIIQIIEPLRKSKIENLEVFYSKLIEEKQNLKNLLKN